MKKENGFRYFMAILVIFLILGLTILIWGAVTYRRPPLYFNWSFGPVLQSLALS